jgi:hypothetical protein
MARVRQLSPSEERRHAPARRSPDGRLLVLAAVAAYASAVAIGGGMFGVNLWPYLGVNPAPTLFYDARNVAAAADCWAMGHDPLVDNPCDPAGRVMNYPRVWLVLHFVGVTQDRTLLFGGVVVLLFLASVWYLTGRLSLAHGLIVAAAVVSPAVMLAIERANMDLVLFAVFVVAVAAWETRDRVTSLASPALILAAAIAKLYAISALPAYLLTGERRFRWIVPAGGAVMALYLALTFRDFRVVMSAPEGGLLYSFGARILIGDLYHRFVPGEWGYGSTLAQLIAVVPVVVLSTLVWRWARRRHVPLPPPEQMSAVLLAFHLGALTYLGTFLTRKSGDYRLVFLLLTLPLLLRWSEGSPGLFRTGLARVGLVAVLAGLWVGALSPFIGPWDELASWALALTFVVIVAVTAPRWRDLWSRTSETASASASSTRAAT